jgi:hypothetical protein
MEFGSRPTWASFVNSLKEEFYPFGNYDDQYMRWKTMHYERDQTMPKYTNIFDTLCSKIGIIYYERHLILKYCNGLHRYIQVKMDFLDISLLGSAHRFIVKININSRRGISGISGLPNHHNRSMVKASLTHITRDRAMRDSPEETKPICRQRRVMGSQRTLEIGVSSIKYTGTTMMNVARNSHCWLSLKKKIWTLARTLI